MKKRPTNQKITSLNKLIVKIIKITKKEEKQHGQFRGRESKRANDAPFDRVVSELGLNKDQRRRLHDKISGKGLDYDGIKDKAKALFNK
jgi:hypothetical protein